MGATTDCIQKYIHVSYAAYAIQTITEPPAIPRRRPPRSDQRRPTQIARAPAGTNAPPGTEMIRTKGRARISIGVASRY